MNDYLIELEKLSCKIGYKYLSKDITWQVKKGDRWVVFGMNGCGKTTLLSIVAGFKNFSSGNVKLLGRELSETTIIQVRKKIGWISASFFDKCYTKESVIDIVLSGKFGTLGLDGTITVKDRKHAMELLLELGLGRKSEYAFDMLSKGERQNVLIARALFSKPEILIMDEPCTGLDIYNREYLFQTIEKLAARKNITLIYITHYVEEISPIFTNCLLLKNGREFIQGNIREIFTSSILTDFLDHPVELQKREDESYQIKVINITANIIDYIDY